MAAAALVFHAWGTGHFMQRTALTMPLHELGHAVASWWSGFAAIPTLWKTMIPETRGLVAPVVVGAIAVALVYFGWRAERIALWVTGLAVGAIAFAGNAMISTTTAHAMITFAGDGGAMVLGTLLAMTFFVGPDSKLRAGGLRYGLLAIGAAAFVDTFSTWWSARTNEDVIPFGEIEGVGLSDPSKLHDVYGWTTSQLVGRYVTLGAICLAALVACWLYAVRASYTRSSTASRDAAARTPPAR